MTKKNIRKLFLDKRASISERDQAIAQDLLLIRFQDMTFENLSMVHTYLPIVQKKEPDPGPLLRFLEFRFPGIQFSIPRTDLINGTMTHWKFDEHTIIQEDLNGIPEPQNGNMIDIREIDLVIVPLLAFDNRGFRVGYGKGFYDRFLPECRKDAIRLGLSFFDAVDHIDDIQEYDIPLHYCVTPDRIHEF